jgi:hypothetical protein
LHLLGPPGRLYRPSPHSPHEVDTQHSPPSESCGGHRHARYLATYKQLILRQYLGHHIRPILVGMDLLKLRQLGTHHLSNSMCLVRAWKLRFLARWIALWLSQYRVYFSCFMSSSCKKFCIQSTSLHASTVAMYSASMVDNETHFCNLDF